MSMYCSCSCTGLNLCCSSSASALASTADPGLSVLCSHRLCSFTKIANKPLFWNLGFWGKRKCYGILCLSSSSFALLGKICFYLTKPPTASSPFLFQSSWLHGTFFCIGPLCSLKFYVLRSKFVYALAFPVDAARRGCYVNARTTAPAAAAATIAQLASYFRSEKLCCQSVVRLRYQIIIIHYYFAGNIQPFLINENTK